MKKIFLFLLSMLFFIVLFPGCYRTITLSLPDDIKSYVSSGMTTRGAKLVVVNMAPISVSVDLRGETVLLPAGGKIELCFPYVFNNYGTRIPVLVFARGYRGDKRDWYVSPYGGHSNESWFVELERKQLRIR